MTSKKTRLPLLALALSLFLALSGCFRMEMNMTFNEDETADVSFHMVDTQGMFFNPELGGVDSCDELFAELDMDMGFPGEVEHEQYTTDDGHTACSQTAQNIPLTDLDGIDLGELGDEGGIQLNDGVYTISIPADAEAAEEVTELPGASVVMSFSFPGEVLEYGDHGTLSEDGRSVQFSSPTLFSEGVYVEAEAAESGAIFSTTIVLIVGGVLLLALLVSVPLLIARNKNEETPENSASSPDQDESPQELGGADIGQYGASPYAPVAGPSNGSSQPLPPATPTSPEPLPRPNPEDRQQ